MSRHLRRFFKAVQSFGIRDGVAAYYLYLRHRLFPGQKWTLRQVRLTDAPVWIRPGASDWIVMERIFMDREYDPVSYEHDRFMDKIQDYIVSAGKTPLIIDCGANVGLSSVWFSQRFPRAKVVAIEPEAANFKVLALTARGFPNIVPMNAAVSCRMGKVYLTNAGDTPWSWKTQEARSGNVLAVTIPHIAGLYANHQLMVVKVDIEGFEINLLEDGAPWVDGLPLMVFEMHDWMTPWSGSGHAFFSVLSREKRDYLIRGENVFAYSDRLLAGAGENVLGKTEIAGR